MSRPLREVPAPAAWRRAALLLALLLPLGISLPASGGPSGEPPAAGDSVYTTGPKSDDGIGKFYMGREISFVMGHLGAGWLERPEREVEDKPEQVIDNMGLRPDSVVADIGAGTGYFSFRIARRVPGGRVLAVDIQPEMLEEIHKRSEQSGLRNVVGVLGTISDPKLDANSVDFALLVDAYHEFSHPREMMTGIVRGLRPGGRVVLVEYRGEDPDVPILPHHKMTEAQARKELAAVGLRWVETKEFLPQQHMMIFEKPAAADGKEGKEG